jgi:hypothetical protein
MTTILLSAWLLVDERSYNHQINAIIARHMPSLAEAVTRTFMLGEASLPDLSSLWPAWRASRPIL